MPGRAYNPPRERRPPWRRLWEVRDPDMAQRTCIVTGKTFDDETSGYKWNYEGKWFYFADIAARNRFIGNPKQFLEDKEKTQA